MRLCDPENSAGGGSASGRYNQAGKINGERPDKRAAIPSTQVAFIRQTAMSSSLNANGLI